MNGRRNAELNPKAIYRDPMTLEDYLAARMISTPLCLFDCDVPVDGVHRDHRVARRARRRLSTTRSRSRRWAPRCGAAHLGPVRRPDHHGRPATPAHAVGAHRPAARRRGRGRALRRVQLHHACLARGPGVLRPGRGRALRRGRRAIARDGGLPLNTHGGQLSAGRLHGYGFLHEACLQLWGEAGERQVAGAEVAVVANGGGPIAGALLLTREA